MNAQLRRPLAAKALALALHTAGVALGLVLGWQFGQRADGLWLGILAALNGAVFCALLTDAATQRWLLRDGDRPR